MNNHHKIGEWAEASQEQVKAKNCGATVGF